MARHNELPIPISRAAELGVVLVADERRATGLDLFWMKVHPYTSKLGMLLVLYALARGLSY